MLSVVWEQVFGPADLRELDSLFARVIWIADGEIDALSDAASRYREIIGAPEHDDAGGSTNGERPMEGQEPAARPGRTRRRAVVGTARRAQHVISGNI
jgi:hypothetical protein